MHQLTNVQRQHAPTAAHTDRQAWHEHTRMDDTARELLGTTCTENNQTKCKRVPLAKNVPAPPTSVGKDPQGGEHDGPQGGRPSHHRPPRACKGGKGRERVSEKNAGNQQGDERTMQDISCGVRGAGFSARGELGKVQRRGCVGGVRGRRCAPIEKASSRRRSPSSAGRLVTADPERIQHLLLNLRS
jgi:hypothetical protein